MPHPNWTHAAPALARLDPAALAALAPLAPVDLAPGTVLFRPGDEARGFAVVLSGRVDVFLSGPSGREILLYTVEPGSSCVQTTLALLGAGPYSGEAVTARDTRLVMIPRGLFLSLMDGSAAFRAFVFAAFSTRMQDMMQLLERVAFHRVEARLAAELLAQAEGDTVRATHQELATRIGSAREVVSRRLDAMARAGLVATERGVVELRDRPALLRLASTSA